MNKFKITKQTGIIFAGKLEKNDDKQDFIKVATTPIECLRACALARLSELMRESFEIKVQQCCCDPDFANHFLASGIDSIEVYDENNGYTLFRIELDN